MVNSPKSCKTHKTEPRHVTVLSPTGRWDFYECLCFCIIFVVPSTTVTQTGWNSVIHPELASFHGSFHQNRFALSYWFHLTSTIQFLSLKTVTQIDLQTPQATHAPSLRSAIPVIHTLCSSSLTLSWSHQIQLLWPKILVTKYLQWPVEDSLNSEGHIDSIKKFISARLVQKQSQKS